MDKELSVLPRHEARQSRIRKVRRRRAHFDPRSHPSSQAAGITDALDPARMRQQFSRRPVTS